MEKIKNMIEKVLTRDVILYIVFGVLTTCVNLISFYILNSLIHINENIANLIAIPLSILFAYFTNRKWVFHTQARGFTENFKEFCKFIAGRAFTMFIEFFGCMILFKLPIPAIISKLAVNILVIILIFFISKFFAFKKKNKNS